MVGGWVGGWFCLLDWMGCVRWVGGVSSGWVGWVGGWVGGWTFGRTYLVDWGEAEPERVEDVGAGGGGGEEAG